MKSKTHISPRDIQFLFEMGSIRFIQRTWKRFLNPDVENLAEHHFRVAWIALLIAKYEGITDTEKVLKMALVHDIAESRTGDVDYLSRQYVARQEDIGIRDIFSETLLEEEFVLLWEEYELKESIEAQIVKDADNLDVDFEIQELFSKGNSLGGGFKETRAFVAEERLYTKTAKELWKVIQTANPHDWHLLGRNRSNDGDWKRSDK